MQLYEKKTLCVFSSVIGFGLTAGLASAQIDISPATPIAIGVEPDDVAAGDFDGDGDIDLAATVDNPDRVQIALNDGAGNFSLGGSAPLPNSSSPGDIEAGDWDGDGDIDLAVALKDLSSIQILINVDGLFTPTQQASTGVESRGMDSGDYDLDGDMDLVVGNRESNTATVLTNDGTGTFTSTTLNAGAEPRGATFGDFDGDKDLDVAVSNHDSSSVMVFTNTGAGFALGTTLPTGTVRPEDLTAADLNGDGLADIAAATNGNNDTLNQATVWLSTGGAFSGPFSYATSGQDTGDIEAADLDCDGMIDLITTNEDSSNISILPNTGGGTFGAATLMTAGVNPNSLTTADLVGDGGASIAVANDDGNTLSVYLNNTPCDGGDPDPDPPACPSDLDGDGAVGISDLLQLLGDWGECPTK